MTWGCVVPTNRPSSVTAFLDAWAILFAKHNVKLYVVQDLFAPDPAIAQAIKGRGFEIEVATWQTANIGWHPHHTDMIRSWGIHRSYADGTDYTLTLDDDVRPLGDPFESYERAFEAGAPCSPYFDVGLLTSYQGQMRGFPYREREHKTVAVQYGGWNGVLDYDAPTQLAGVREREAWFPLVVHLPRGCAVTGCIMNAAWRTEYAPIMWQLPLLAGRYNRFGDIWSGLFAKKTLDHLGDVMLVNGEASVRHERASDPIANLEREAPGIPVNEDLWAALEAEGDDLLSTYQAVTDSATRFFRSRDPLYSEHFRHARDQWLRLFV